MLLLENRKNAKESLKRRLWQNKEKNLCLTTNRNQTFSKNVKIFFLECLKTLQRGGSYPGIVRPTGHMLYCRASPTHDAAGINARKALDKQRKTNYLLLGCNLLYLLMDTVPKSYNKCVNRAEGIELKRRIYFGGSLLFWQCS